MQTPQSHRRFWKPNLLKGAEVKNQLLRKMSPEIAPLSGSLYFAPAWQWNPFGKAMAHHYV